MYYLWIDMDRDTNTVVLCDVYCYCLISTVVLMCNSRSLITSTGYGLSLRIALLG